MTILITGGAGYIGSHICVELLNAGYEIVVVDNFSNSSPEALQRIRQITGQSFTDYEADLNDREALSRIFEQHAFAAVIHLAGWKAVGESVAKPLAYYRNNIAGTLTLCEVMQSFGVKRIVFSSSATVYGISERVPLTEDEPRNPVNPYGQTKAMIEQILQDVAVADPEWSIALLRYFNPVGAHSSGQIGEDPSGIPNNLMPSITQAAVGKLAELRIFGNDYPTKDGTGVRDYIHVVDLAIGHVKAVEKIMQTTIVEAYNLGTGSGQSVLELVHAFEQVSGKKVPYRIEPRRPGDIAECYADCSKAKQELNWTAQKGIMDMCADAWRWQSHNPRGYPH